MPSSLVTGGARFVGWHLYDEVRSRRAPRNIRFKRYAGALTLACQTAQSVKSAVMRIFDTYGARKNSLDSWAIPASLRQALTDQAITSSATAVSRARSVTSATPAIYQAGVEALVGASA